MNAEPKLPQPNEKEELRILFIEDNPDDLELIFRALRRAKMDFVPDVVQTRGRIYPSGFSLHLMTPLSPIITSPAGRGWTPCG